MLRLHADVYPHAPAAPMVGGETGLTAVAGQLDHDARSLRDLGTIHRPSFPSGRAMDGPADAPDPGGRIAPPRQPAMSA